MALHAIALLIAICTVSFSSIAAASPDKAKSITAADNLASLGFTLLQGNPIDFELPTLDGQPWNPKKARGKWLLMAFWATWCSACDAEMPELESLYEKFKNDRLAIVGISVDQDRASVENFRKKKGILFPIIHDDQGNISSKYRASALPTLYVISPEGKLAGILQGARDWRSGETMAQVSALLANREYKDSGSGIKMVEEEGGLSLPNNLAPPTLNVSLDSDDVTPGTTFGLNVAITWKGDSRDYLIRTPKLTLPAEVSQGEVSSSTSSASEETSLRYTFPVTIAKQGKFKIGPIDLAYSPRVGGKELYARSEGITVETKRASIPWVAIAIGTLSLLAVGFALMRMKTKKPKTTSLAPARDLSRPYEEVRRLKMQGRMNEYATGLLKLCQEIDERAGTRNHTVKGLLEKLKFGGTSLSETELSAFEKKVERTISEQDQQSTELKQARSSLT